MMTTTKKEKILKLVRKYLKTKKLPRELLLMLRLRKFKKNKERNKKRKLNLKRKEFLMNLILKIDNLE